MKKILITGALGHIGSRLIHSIKPGEYDEIIMLDNLSTMRYASLFNLQKGVNFKFIEEDILEVDLNRLLESIDIVVHLAAITDATNSFQIKDKIESVNHIGTKNIAEVCIRQGVKLIFPSTTSVYGSQLEVVDENCSYEELNPQSPYAKYKLKSERMLSKMSKNERLKFTTLRFGTIFGKSIGMRFHTAVNKFCWQAVMGHPLTVWETALNQKRPYLGVQDAINSIRFIIDNDIFNNQIYNVVSTNNTVSEIIKIIEEIVPELRINLTKSEIMNQLSYEVDSSKITDYGFISNDLIDNGIREVIGILKT